MKIEKRKEFLRTLPTGKKFSASEISAICTEYHLVAPVEFLIAKGDECNWLTSQGNSFQSAKTFATTFNGVYCELKREEQRPIIDYTPGQGDLFSFK